MRTKMLPRQQPWQPLRLLFPWTAHGTRATIFVWPSNVCILSSQYWESLLAPSLWVRWQKRSSRRDRDVDRDVDPHRILLPPRSAGSSAGPLRS